MLICLASRTTTPQLKTEHMRLCFWTVIASSEIKLPSKGTLPSTLNCRHTLYPCLQRVGLCLLMVRQSLMNLYCL